MKNKVVKSIIRTRMVPGVKTLIGVCLWSMLSVGWSATIVQTNAVPLQELDWVDLLDFNGFDPALGTLDSVTITLDSEMSGDMTSDKPSERRVGSWKQSDLPDPVGMTTAVSHPRRIGAMARAWPGRSSRWPKTWCRIS